MNFEKKKGHPSRVILAEIFPQNVLFDGWVGAFSSKCFIPRRESSRRLPRGPIEYSFHFIGVGNGSRGFKNTNVNKPFWNLEIVLFHGVGWDGVSNGSFNFLYTLCVYRSCIYILIYILKNCHQHSYGFQNLMSSWGSWSKISKLERVGDFFFFWSKSSLLKHAYPV